MASHSNLLDFYREHRGEVDILTDEKALFALALIHHFKLSNLESLARHLGSTLGELLAICRKLQNAGMVRIRDLHDPTTGIKLLPKGVNVVTSTIRQPIRRKSVMVFREQRVMTKVDLVGKVAEIGITKKQAAMVVDAVIDGIRDALAADDKVSLIGFGTFSVKERAAREGRNPRTGKKIKIPKKKVPTFKPSKGLKDSIS